ncbi:BPL-N domain-containing protein [Amycolatopsis sp. NBC_01488]|uniref:BPL-N domain-containing protein n=1 Tax=Amycolatopsis sp. NBC_01488 TaxID=2903563 RepID=UPI002E28D51B|nr:BPL-N domain-containing protein [Amycolatopsis sp. NBC_01488]
MTGVSRRGLLAGVAAAGLLAACGGPDTQPLALVYRGDGATDPCSDAVASLLRTHSKGFRVEYCGPDQQIPLTTEALSGATLYAQPGGGGLDDAWRVMRRHADVIKGYVHDGGRYLGFCLGGYLAGATPGFALLPGDTRQYVTSRGADVRSTRDTLVEVDWTGRRHAMYFQDGPQFVLTGPAEVLARYTNGTIAAAVATYGRGRVAVTGPHPEAPESWYRDAKLTDPGNGRLDLGFAFVDRALA